MSEEVGKPSKVLIALIGLAALIGAAGTVIVLFVIDPWCNIRAQACVTRPTVAPFTVTHESWPRSVEEQLRRDDSMPAVRKISVSGDGRLLDVAFRTRGLCEAVEGPTQVRSSHMALARRSSPWS